MIELTDSQKKIMRVIKELGAWHTKRYIFNFVQRCRAMDESDFCNDLSFLVKINYIMSTIFVEGSEPLYRGRQ